MSRQLNNIRGYVRFCFINSASELKPEKTCAIDFTQHKIVGEELFQHLEASEFIPSSSKVKLGTFISRLRGSVKSERGERQIDRLRQIGWRLVEERNCKGQSLNLAGSNLD